MMFGSWFVLVTVVTFATAPAENQPTKEVQTPDESHGGETQTTESEEADLGLVNQHGHNTHEGDSSPKLMLQSHVATLQTMFSVAAKPEFITTATSQGRALSRHSSFEKNREHFPTAFRWAIEQETTVTSSSAERLAPRLSSWVTDLSSIRVSSSFNRLFVRTNRRRRHFVTSSTTQEGQALLMKGRTYFIPQSSVFTEKTMLSSTIVSTSFAPIGRSTNVGQANHASVFRAGNSSVTSSLSQRWVSRRTLDNMSSLGMQSEMHDTSFSGQKDKKATLLIRELSTPTQDKASATTTFRDMAARSFRSTPSVEQTFQDKSRNLPSSGKETFTPSGRQHGISTAALSKHPVLSSTPPVVSREISVGPPWGTVNSLRGTTDGAGRKPSDSSIMGMMASVMDTPSGAQTQSKSNSQDKESVIMETLILGGTSSRPPVSKRGSQFLGAPTRSVDINRQSEAHVTSRQIVVIASSSSHEGTFSRINVGFSSRGDASSTPTMPPSSLGGLRTSFANSITVAAGSSKFSRAPSKFRAFSRASLPNDVTPMTSASTVTDKLSSSSKTADLHSSERELHPSVSRSLVVSSSVEVTVVSSEYPILFQTSQLEDTSAFSTTAVPPPSENAAPSTTKLVVLSSESPTLLRKPSVSVQLSSSPLNIVRSMSLSRTISSSELPLYTSTELKSSELLRATRSSTVTSSIGAALVTRTVDVSPNKTASTVPQFLGSLHHSRGDVNITVTTTYQRTVATAGLSAAQSSDGVGLATLSPRFSSPVPTTGQPATTSTSSSSDVKQPTAIPRFSSRDKSVGHTSAILKPFPTSTSQSSSSTSFILPLSPSPAPEQTSNRSSHMSMLILIATVPSVFLGIIIGLLICRYHRGKNRHKGTHYSIKVEYTDDVRRRPRKRANSRLDLAVNGIHIDLEFPNSSDGRDSVRISRGTRLSEGQIREKLEWLNEVLAKEVASPFSGTDSGVLFRDSALESGGKIVRRESSKRSRENFFLKRLLSREKDSVTELGEESRKEAIEFKALPAAAEDAPMNDTLGKDAECIDEIHEARLPDCETLGTEIKSGGNDTDNQDKGSSSGNKMRYYPLARTRKESKRLRFETL